MSKIKKGDKFGLWTVIGDNSEYIKASTKWLCKCDCGTIRYVDATRLRRSLSKSCGCANKKYADVKVGDRFGKLTVLQIAGAKERKLGYEQTAALCKCDCGNEKWIADQNLKKGLTKSCGCESAINPKDERRDDPTITHMLKRASDIINRCRRSTDPKFYNYGGRGIKCELGDDPVVVAHNLLRIPGYFEGAQLDRIDNNGNYTIWHNEHGYKAWVYHDPVLDKDFKAMGNLRWVDNKTNGLNTVRQSKMTESEYPLRLLQYSSFKRQLKKDGLNEDDFIKCEFTRDLHSNGNKLYIFVPKSEKDKLEYYVNRINKFYDKWSEQTNE